jgi:hypothetical protein
VERPLGYGRHGPPRPALSMRWLGENPGRPALGLAKFHRTRSSPDREEATAVKFSATALPPQTSHGTIATRSARHGCVNLAGDVSGHSYGRNNRLILTPSMAIDQLDQGRRQAFESDAVHTRGGGRGLTRNWCSNPKTGPAPGASAAAAAPWMYEILPAGRCPLSLSHPA